MPGQHRASIHLVQAFCALERQLQLHCVVEAKHEGQQTPVISPFSSGVKMGTRNCLQQYFYWIAAIHLKLGTSQPIRCGPAIAYLLHWTLDAHEFSQTSGL